MSATAPIYVPHTVWLPSGLGVAAGRYDAELVGDGRALVPVRRYVVPSEMAWNEAWAYPMGMKGQTARIYLQPGEFEMEGSPPDGEAPVEAPAVVRPWIPNSPVT